MVNGWTVILDWTATYVGTAVGSGGKFLPATAFRRVRGLSLRHRGINLMVAHLAIVYLPTIHLTVIYLAVVYLTVICTAGRASRISGGFSAAIANVATGTAGG